ncbi:hypothetical protein QCA50_010103 [Cerrena zonata]|uniref:Cytochrome P450 n=1 Tax=Cerrena zonata TaxID=2478898 RepID=A0AAW0FZ69_9APHY
MLDSTLYTYVATALVAILFYRWRFANFYDIPTIGPSLPILSYLGAYRFLHDNRAMIKEGYERFKGGVFKVAMLDRWLIIISGPDLIEEVRKLPDEQVSFAEAVDEFFQLRHTFGRDITSTHLHVDVIRNQLTRNISTIFEDFRDEIVAVFDDLIPATQDKWSSIATLPTMQTMVARVSSRVFVGLPLCRNEEYLQIAVSHTKAIARIREVLLCFPPVLKPIAGLFLGESKRGNRVAEKFLGPIIQKRMKDIEMLGEDWVDKPNDMLQWIIDAAVSKGLGVREIVLYTMIVNFGAIHTSSNSLTHALYHLAANPEYVQPLREEVDSVIKEEGWTKAAMQKLKKVDSFMRESLRVNGINGLSLTRKALQSITLSSGTFIPAGTMLTAASLPTHMDPNNYSDPTVFNPWRFSEIRGQDGESTRHQFVSTSVEYIPFGHGKHACPGRFFAANELKAIFAHVVMNYDIRFANDGPRPENVWFANTVIPDPTAKVLFRKRSV